MKKKKTGIQHYADRCELFGARLKMRRDGSKDEHLAVVKAWLPCTDAGFVVVFDDRPHIQYHENLMRRGRKDWRVVEWEGDIFETMDLRPICPGCGHPLDTGRAAWTWCKACGFNEPGAMSTEMLTRSQSGDPYRRRSVPFRQNFF